MRKSRAMEGEAGTVVRQTRTELESESRKFKCGYETSIVVGNATLFTLDRQAPGGDNYAVEPI